MSGAGGFGSSLSVYERSWALAAVGAGLQGDWVGFCESPAEVYLCTGLYALCRGLSPASN